MRAPLLLVLAMACGGTSKTAPPGDSAEAVPDTGYRDSDGDGHPDVADCGPADPSVFPGARETCNAIDDDCDGDVDDDDATNADDEPRGRL